jgi:hypothetical protein
VAEIKKIKETKHSQQYASLYRAMKSKVTASIEWITPEIAADWLTRNKHNRPLGTGTVGRYARYVKNGEWVVNGEPIIIDDDDCLNDGQHRLQAVVETGTPVPMLVVYGVPKETFPTLNTGKTRSLADVLAIQKETNQRALAGAIRLFHRHESGRLANRGGGRERVSYTELLALLDEHPDIRGAVEWITPMCKKRFHPPSVVSFLYYQMSRSRPEIAKQFFTAILTGEGIQRGSIESRLNEWLLRNCTDSSQTRTQEGIINYMAVFVKAWRSRVVGGPIPTVLSWRPGTGEQFPKIV